MCVIQLKSSGLPISLVHVSRTTPPSKSRCYCVVPVMLLRPSFRHRYGVRQCPLFAPKSSPSIMCFRPYPLHIAVARVQSSAMPGWNRNEMCSHGIGPAAYLRTLSSSRIYPLTYPLAPTAASKTYTFPFLLTTDLSRFLIKWYC